MKRLCELNPQWWQIYRDRQLTPDRGGFPTDIYELRFTCPSCGPPNVILVKIGLDPPDASAYRWQANILPDGPTWPERLTVTPSIDQTRSGHGRRQPNCAFHGTIMNGVIVP